jgi:hypothetical protein
MLNTESALPVTAHDANMVAPASSTSNASIADSKRPATVATALRDDARMLLEAACVDLICQFESMLTRSARESVDGYRCEIVPIVERSLQNALEFGETHFKGKALELLNSQVLEARECTQSLRDAISSFEWKTLRRLIGRESASELDVLRIHGELGTAIAMVLVAALGPAIEMLDTKNKSGAEVLEIASSFMAELEERW